MSSVVFAESAPDYVDELLSARRLREDGVVEPRAAELLVAKARRRGGRLSGEREEMALIAILTTQLLAGAFLREFDGRAAQRAASLAGTGPSVLEDRVGVESA
jgi:asparagine synthase (glutamine-hydrolysing)